MANAARTATWVLLVAVAGLGIAVLISVGAGAPRMEFSARRHVDSVEFNLALHHANGLLHVTVLDRETKQILWHVDLDYYLGPFLTYGTNPRNFLTFNGNRGSARQTIPAPGRPPPPLEVGKEMIVVVGYQYDSFSGACATSECFAFTLVSEGKVSSRRAESAEAR